MTGAAPALPDRDDGLTPPGYALPDSGLVPGLTARIVELLGIGAGDILIDLCGSGGLPSLSISNEMARRSRASGVSPFGERVARLVSTSGVRTVQMSALAFGRFAMRYDKVLLRGGFANLRDHGRPLLALLFERLDPTARFLVIDIAPSDDAPLFAEALSRWEHRQCPAAAVARMVHEAGFATETAVAELVRHVPIAECRAWIESRAWPILETFSDTDLERGLRELAGRYGAQPMVRFTSRFELVLGTKLQTAG